MSKFNKFLLILVIILLLALIGVIYWQKIGFQKPYYAVYLETGDLYFGKLSKISRYTLSDAYLLQRNLNDSEMPFSLQRLDQVFWQPENKIKLNPDKVVWVAKLKPGSEIMNFLTGIIKEATSTNNVSQ